MKVAPEQPAPSGCTPFDVQARSTGKLTGATLEMRVTKAAETGGGTAFADLVWKPVVLVEMKKRGADLQKHYRQDFDDWTRITGGRFRNVVLCNLDEIQIRGFFSHSASTRKNRYPELASFSKYAGALFVAVNVSPVRSQGPFPSSFCATSE